MTFLSALAILLIALKLFGIVGWSWWLVLAPVLVCPIAWAVFFLLAIIGSIGVSRRPLFEPMIK